MRSLRVSTHSTQLGLLGLFCLAVFSDVSSAQTPPQARVIAKPKLATPIAHLDIAPNDRWILSSSGEGDDFQLWNLKAPNNPRTLPGQYFAWSRDGARLATWDDPKADSGSKGKQRLTILDLPTQRVAQFSFDLPTTDSALDFNFSPDRRAVALRARNYKHTITWNFDTRTGKMRAVKETQGSRTTMATSKRHFVQSDYKEVGTQVQVYDLSGHEIYEWHNPSEYDGWELSSDDALMWRASADTGRFNFYDTLSGHLLWRLPTPQADSGSFGHYPHWSHNGKVVAFVKGQTVRTYDARTGKVLHTVSGYPFSPNAFKDWRDAYAISQHGDFVVVADAKNQLWRVTLK